MIGQGNGFGVSFLPNGDQRYQRPEDRMGAAAGRAPLQEAVKILSMRVPRVLGANPLAPMALLQGQGAGGMQPGQLEQLMRTLGIGPSMQSGQVPTAGGADMSVGGAPSPLASMQGLMPTAGGAGPSVSVTAGAREDPGASTLATPPSPQPPASGPSMAPEDDSAAMWELARRQRESMGRIAY